MRQELKNAFGRVFLTIEVDAKNRWVYVNWMGHLTADNVRAGAEAYTAALKQAGYSCVLNDTRLILGSWDHSMDWVLHRWAPRAASSGLRHFAMITAPETFGGSSASRFYADLKAFQARVFEERGKAEEWLRQCSQQGGEG